MQSRHVYLFSFDGTLTDIPHEKTVLSDFFERAVDTDNLDDMVPDPEKFPLYVTMQEQKLTSKEIEKRANEIENKIAEMIQAQSTNQAMDLAAKPYLLTAGAVDYLRLLVADPNNSVIIVSNNMEEYIRGVLHFNEFTPEQMKEIVIADYRFHKGDKSRILVDLFDELNNIGPLASVTIYENNSADMKAMKQMTSECCAPNVKIATVERKPGQFLYAAYATELSVNKKEPEIRTRQRSDAIYIKTKTKPVPPPKPAHLANINFFRPSPQEKAFAADFMVYKAMAISQLTKLVNNMPHDANAIIGLTNLTIKDLLAMKVVNPNSMNQLSAMLIKRQHDMVEFSELNPNLTNEVKSFLQTSNELLQFSSRGENHYIALREELFQKVNIDLQQRFSDKPDIDNQIKRLNQILYDPSIKNNESFGKAIDNLLELFDVASPLKANQTNPLIDMLRETQEKLQQNKPSLRA